MIGRWLLLFLALSLSAGAAEAWRLPRGVFPHEIAVLDDTAFVASTEGLWRLEAKEKVKRIGGAQRASWPLAAAPGRLWWMQDSRVMELDAATGTIRPVRSLAATRVGVISRRHGLYFADDEAGLVWSADGDAWHGPVPEAQHSSALDRLGDEWWAITNPDPDNTDKFVLSRSRDLRAWVQAAEFIGRQPGSLAAGAGRVVVSEISGVRVFDLQALPRSTLVTVGPDDERPAVYFAHGHFWLQGERDGLWRSADGRDWQNLQAVLAPLEAPLVQVGFAPDALVLAGYTGKIICVPLASLPSF
ncbi:MAG: hypothetical protein KIT44_15655 [Opitutaceae bacterium]|nr:hypothetical protein [Opitutaceae bacterium]